MTTTTALPRTIWQFSEDVLDDIWGGVNPATYDTAHLVLQSARRPDRVPDSLAANGLRLLLRSQGADGSWGSPYWPGRYRLVPTLAACAALAGAPGTEPVGALRRGLEQLASAEALFAPESQPDLMAVEYIVPALLEHLIRALRKDEHPLSADVRSPLLAFCERTLARWEHGRLRLVALRAAVAGGRPVPVHLAYSAELFDFSGSRIDSLATELPLGCSASATTAYAAWSAAPKPAAVELLRRQAERLDGGLPVVMRMTTFEALWTLAYAVRSGAPLSDDSPRRLRAWLSGLVGPDGVCAGPGLPPDGDDTATALYLLHRLGAPASPTSLLRFVTDSGCASYPGERTRSTTTTAHALETIAQWLEHRPDTVAAYGPARVGLLEHLLATQLPDGHWEDKWHASPHYATHCAVEALARFGGDLARPAVERALRWTLERRRDDGSWGEWGGTLEETALAVLTLTADSAPAHVLVSAREFLAEHADAPAGSALRTPMWQGKELYEPHRIVHTTVLAARIRAKDPALAPHTAVRTSMEP
ncbi:hypothetical protein ACWD5V_40925 [Streptomyces sp. NPDC002523]